MKTDPDSDPRAQLQEIRKSIHDHAPIIKPFFGLLFWECVDLGPAIDPEHLVEQGMHLSMYSDHDEIIGEFLAAFFQVWRSSRDLNATSRFVAEALNMSAAELLETRAIYLQREKLDKPQ